MSIYIGYHISKKEAKRLLIGDYPETTSFLNNITLDSPVILNNLTRHGLQLLQANSGGYILGQPLMNNNVICDVDNFIQIAMRAKIDVRESLNSICSIDSMEHITFHGVGEVHGHPDPCVIIN